MRKKTDKDLLNLNKTVKKSVANFKPPEQLTVTEWADKYRRLSSENSAEAGRWRTSRTPYLEEIMNAFTDPRVHRIVVGSSSQIGKTEVEMNMLGYAIDIDPGPIMFVHPTDKTAQDFSKRRLAPMIRDTARLRKKVAAAKGRDSSNTVLKKSYPGGMLTITGSNSASDLASVPARYVFGDERDRWATDAGGEGDPWGLVEARTTTFYNYKMVEVSTPTKKGASNIEASFELGTKEYWSVACPMCGEYNYIEFDHILFNYRNEKQNGKNHYIVESAEYSCPHCGGISSEQEVKKAQHKWIAKNPEAIKNGVRSFWINAFSSPWMGWKKLVLRFLEAKDNPEKLQTVFNTLFGQLWEDRGELQSEDEMLNRREDYGAELHEKVLCLTMGVDTQDNRLEYEVVGHGLYGETYGIEKGFIMGKPDSGSEVWRRLDGVIDKVYTFADGVGMKVSVTFIDSGGHYTQEVYEYCKSRQAKKVFACKGKGGDGIPFVGIPSKIKIKIEGRKPATGWLYVLGVDAGKERIMSSIKVQEPGANYCHFPKDEEKGYDLNFFNGLLSEKMVLSRTKSGNRWTWEKLPGHQRNEALDCRNYAMAAFRALNPDMNALERSRKGKKAEKIVVKQPKRRKKTTKKDVYSDW